MISCGVCMSAFIETVLELGPQPVSTHFTNAPIVSSLGTAAVEHDLSLAVCRACGTIQIAQPFPFRYLVPTFDWITYREPESHLDAVVDKICGLQGVDENSTIAGVSYKDKTTLDRLSQRGFRDVWMIDPFEDLGATDPNANIESVHGLLTAGNAAEIAARRGPADVLIARHILEHAETPRRFMQALESLLAPSGHLVIEVPDCTANLKHQDYTMIWEEHSLYLTPETLPRILDAAQLEFLGLDIHPNRFENVIVLYGNKTPAPMKSGSLAEASAIEDNVTLARRYGEAFNGWCEGYRRLFETMVTGTRQLAAYGAGHLTCSFLNFHGLSDYFAFVVDDTLQKQGLHLPKSGLPVVPREHLDSTEIAVCLLGLSPEIEKTVIANNKSFTKNGGAFYSMFADSDRSIRKLMAGLRR